MEQFESILSTSLFATSFGEHRFSELFGCCWGKTVETRQVLLGPLRVQCLFGASINLGEEMKTLDAEGNEDTGSSERHWVSTSTFPLTNTSKIRYKTGTGHCLVLWFLKMRWEISLYWKLETRNSLYWKSETRNSLYRKFETRNSLYQTGNTKQKLCLISSGLMVTISSCIYVFRYTNTNLDLTLKVGGWRSLRLKTYIPQA